MTVAVSMQLVRDWIVGHRTDENYAFNPEYIAEKLNADPETVARLCMQAEASAVLTSVEIPTSAPGTPYTCAHLYTDVVAGIEGKVNALNIRKLVDLGRLVQKVGPSGKRYEWTPQHTPPPNS